MRQTEDNATMFETTNKVLDDNNSSWSGIPAFVDAVTRAKSGVTAIRIKQGQQLATGDTTAKRNARDDAEQNGLAIGGDGGGAGGQEQ